MFWRTVVRRDENAPRASVYDVTMSHLVSLGAVEGQSFSGNERNNLFLSVQARQFADVSGLSGFDHPADGRGLALLDYDRDGWLDFGVVNANTPLFQLFRNEIGVLAKAPRAMLALRFVGGNRGALPSQEWTARDGYGAVAEIGLGETRLVREHRAGEGFAAQNSRTLLVGLGEGVDGAPLAVRWPSGREQQLAHVPADSLVTVYEDPAASPDGSGFAVEPYRTDGLHARAKRRSLPRRRLDVATRGDVGAAPLRLVTTMATWCEACRGELPQLALLREQFDTDELALLGVPVDDEDDAAKLTAYEREHAPAYQLLKELSADEVAAVKQHVIDELRVDALPAAILTDARGRVLETLWEVPSVSKVRELLQREGA